MGTQPQTRYTILLIGDACVDVYEYGEVKRLSPEAPVPVFRSLEKYQCAGMAGNVKNNLEALGCSVIDVFGTGPLSIKTRYIDRHSKQHIVRVDYDQHASPITPFHLPKNWKTRFDAIVVSDYSKGSVTVEFIEWLRRECELPIFVDTKIRDLRRLEGCVVKINEHEYSQIVSESSHLIVTMGSRGARYNGHLFPTPPIDVTDVCGAGDTFLAALAYYTLQKGSITAAIPYANKASSVTVQHLGVYAPTVGEIDAMASIAPGKSMG